MASKASDFYYLDQYEEASRVPLTPKNAPFIIGSYCFLGEHDQARALYKEYAKHFNEGERVFSLFHLGISYTRTSEYVKAREIFFENWRMRHCSLGHVEKFLIYQGLSFFRYFFSKHESSLAFARKAEFELSKNKKKRIPLYEALVQELIGHNYFQLGRPAKGEAFFKKALSVAKENNFIQLKEEFEASLLIYQSQFELDLQKNINRLKKLLKKTSESNDYTFSELVLQISKLYFLKGQFKKANDFLLQNFNVIYKNDNKRKVAILNTLLAQLLLPKQQYIEALSLLKVAKNNLNDEIDLNLLAPILGIEEKVLTLLKQDSSETEHELKKILQKTDKAILHHINKRQSDEQGLSQKEDFLGELFDRVKKGELSCLDIVVENEILYLIPELFGLTVEKKAIIVHPKNEGLFFVDEESIHYSSKRLSKSQIQFISALESAPQSKENLVKEVWGYQEYDPFRHDHLVYTMVKRVRQIFGDRANWIVALGDDQYRIDPDVNLILRAQRKEKKKEESPKRNLEEFPEDLNFRQVQLLEGIFDGPFSAGEVAQYFNTTRMTSYRDLDDLVKKGYLFKRGKNKGTRYDLI